MKSVRIAELNDHLSKHLRAVERGAEIEVLDRDRPIARIVPAGSIRKPLRSIKPKLDFVTIREHPPRPANWKISSLDLLLEERGRQ